MSQPLEEIVDAATKEICFLGDNGKVRDIVRRVAEQARSSAFEATGASRERLRQQLYDKLYGHHGLFSPCKVWPVVDSVLSDAI